MILITGTPRTGTTFLIQLFHALGFETGFETKYHEKHQKRKHQTHGGIEWARDSKITKNYPEVIKHPWTIREKAPWKHKKLKNIKFDYIIITNRLIEDSVLSIKRMERIKKYDRGVESNDPLNEKRCKHFIYANEELRKYWPNHIEIEFPKSALNVEYLWSKLEPIMENRITKKEFIKTWNYIAKKEYVTSSRVSGLKNERFKYDRIKEKNNA